MHRKSYCYECEKEQTFYYFMMMPAGCWVCDVCGTTEGCVKCKVKEVFFKDIRSFELLMEVFKIINLTGDIDPDSTKTFHLPIELNHLMRDNRVYFSEARNFDELMQLLRIISFSIGDTNLGKSKTFKELIRGFNDCSVSIDDDNPSEMSEELSALCKEVDSQKAIASASI